MKNNLLPKQSILNIVRLTVVIACGVLAGNYMLASPAQAVTISQPILEINAAPGETIYQLEQLYDDSKKGVTVYPWVYNFTENPDREGSALILTDPADLKPDREWIKYDTSRVDLPADGSLVDFPYRIEVPENGEPGTHLISLVFRSRPPTEKDLAGTTVYIGSTVATNIFLKVSGRIVDLINVEFQSGEYTNDIPGLPPDERKKFFRPKNFFIKPPVEFLLTVNNEGNTHQKPDGNVRIVNDLFGGDPEKLLVNPENRIILSNSDRTYAVPSFGQGFMFGKYRAKLTLLYGDPLRDITQEITFWIVPVVELLIALGVLILIILLLLLIWYLLNKKREKENQEGNKLN